MTLHLGQQVVCVNSRGATELEEGRIYTVSYTACLPDWICVEGVGEWNELGPPGWWAHRFRPLVERKTNISIFTKMLTPTLERVT